jgi:WD40 repeat protein
VLRRFRLLHCGQPFARRHIHPAVAHPAFDATARHGRTDAVSLRVAGGPANRYMHAPADIDTKLGVPPPRCFLPKREIHKWTGHTKGVNTVKLLPQTAHLLLTCAMDNKVKLWEVYGKRRLLRTFHGHTAGVRDIAFNNDGSRFLSAGYDKVRRQWQALAFFFPWCFLDCSFVYRYRFLQETAGL